MQLSIKYPLYVVGTKLARAVKLELVEADGSTIVGVVILSTLGVLGAVVLLSDVKLLIEQSQVQTSRS
jgi:hypothetical protein